jgi:hypothetical protein
LPEGTIPVPWCQSWSYHWWWFHPIQHGDDIESMVYGIGFTTFTNRSVIDIACYYPINGYQSKLSIYSYHNKLYIVIRVNYQYIVVKFSYQYIVIIVRYQYIYIYTYHSKLSTYSYHSKLSIYIYTIDISYWLYTCWSNYTMIILWFGAKTQRGGSPPRWGRVPWTVPSRRVFQRWDTV